MRDTGPRSSASQPGRLQRLGLLAILVAALCSLTGGSAQAAYIHPEPGYEFGPNGLSTSAFPGSGSVAEMDFDQSSKRIFMLDKSDGKIYAVHFAGAATYTEAGPPYPLTVASAGCCTDVAVDNTAGATAENLYYSPDGPSLFGFAPTGTALPAFVPESGEKCGAAVDDEGHFWSGNFSTRKMEEFEPTGGAPIKTIDVSATGAPCRIRFDLSNDDMYVSQYFGEGAVRYTAASGYAASSAQVFDHTSNSTIAINASRHVAYVAGREKVSAYDTATGSLLEEFGEEPGCSINGIAVDDATDTVFLSRGCTNKIQEWKGAVVPDAVTGEPTGNSQVSGSVALAGGGEVTSCRFEFGETTAYGQEAPCNPAAPYTSDQGLVTAELKNQLEGEHTYHYRLAASNANGTAHGVDKTITPHNVKLLTTGPASAITNNSAHVSATFEGNGESTSYYFEYGRTLGYGHTAPLPAGDAGSPVGPTTIGTDLAGLSPGAIYHYRVVATNGFGTSRAQDQTFSTYALPSIVGFSTSNVTATSADISALINPNGFETEYEVQYGPTMSYGKTAPVPAGVLPATESAEEVSVHLSGLEGIVYHFRIVAKSTWGTTITSDRTFTFFPPSCPNSVLRQKTGSSYLPDCRAYELVSPENAGNIILKPISRPAPYAQSPTRFLYVGLDGVLSGTMGTNALSADTYVAQRTATGWTSRYTGIPSNETPENWFGASDLSADKFMNFKTSCCSKIPYVYDNTEAFLGRWPADFENYPGSQPVNPNGPLGNFQPSPDFSHMAFASQTNFDPNGEGVTGAPGSAYDYDVATETTTIISKDAEGHDIAQDPANTNANEVIEFPGWSPRGSGMPKEINPSVSTNGSHILMSTEACEGCSNRLHLYMRVSDAITYDIAEGHAVHYYGMTSDGKEVFFTSGAQLTEDDHDSSVDLYMWSEQGQLEEKPLTRLSVGSGGQGDTDACNTSWTSQCDVSQVEGSRSTDYPIATEHGDVYFYSPEILDTGEEGVDGARNLYVYRNGAVRYVTTLSLDGSGALTSIQVSPDGAHAAFVTTARLSAYDNAGFAEMYAFDATSGELQCASCIPSGEPPTSDVVPSVSGLFMSDDGRPFFVTEDALVARDTDEATDVYEYVEGRPQLISSGTGQIYRTQGGDVVPIRLMGVSPNGVDVYFATYETLVPQDRNGAFLKFYDARTGGGFEFTRSSPGCEAADECHEAGSAPPAPAVITSNSNLGNGGNAPQPAKGKTKKKRKKAVHKRRRRGKAKSDRGARHG